MLLENRIEDVVGRRQEYHRADEEPHRDEDVAQIGPVGIYGHEGERQERHREQTVVDVHRPGGNERHCDVEQPRSESQRGKVDHARTPPAVHHRLRERADQNHQHEQRHRREQERENEECGDEEHRDAEPLVQPLAVEDEEERAEHDTRAGVVLQDDDEERDADDHPHLEEVARTVYREGVCAHDARHGERRGNLGELDGLHAEGAELEPRLGAVDLAAEEQRRDQQRQTDEIGRVGKHVEVAHVKQQQHDGRGPRHADPDELLHVEVAEGEEVARRPVVRGRGDGEPPRYDDEHVEQDRTEVHAVENRIVPTTGHMRGNRFSCS